MYAKDFLRGSLQSLFMLAAMGVYQVPGWSINKSFGGTALIVATVVTLSFLADRWHQLRRDSVATNFGRFGTFVAALPLFLLVAPHQLADDGTIVYLLLALLVYWATRRDRTRYRQADS